VRVEVYRDGELLATAASDADGRIARLAPAPLVRGTYRLVFRVPSSFVSRLEIDVTVAGPDRHDHIPRLIAPYARTVYRGS